MSIIVDYAEIVQQYGLKSKEAKKFMKEHSNDPVFLLRARVLEQLFLNRRQLIQDWEASEGRAAGISRPGRAAPYRTSL